MKNLRILLRIEGKIRIGRTQHKYLNCIMVKQKLNIVQLIYFRALDLLRIQCHVFKCYVQRNDEISNNKRKAQELRLTIKIWLKSTIITSKVISKQESPDFSFYLRTSGPFK